jgi:hypothetical protein
MDIQFSRHGSLFLARPVSDLGQWWLEGHMTSEALWWADGVVIAPHYVEPILEHMQEDGLEITTGAASIAGQIKHEGAH